MGKVKRCREWKEKGKGGRERGNGREGERGERRKELEEERRKT